MKFILIEQELRDGMILYIPLYFSNNLNHIDVFNKISELLNYSIKNTCVSAGFFNSESDTYFGESTTIGIKSHPLTKSIISMNEYIHVYEKENKPIKEPIKIETK